jgi:hypothetical protein
VNSTPVEQEIRYDPLPLTRNPPAVPVTQRTRQARGDVGVEAGLVGDSIA